MRVRLLKEAGFAIGAKVRVQVRPDAGVDGREGINSKAPLAGWLAGLWLRVMDDLLYFV